MNIPKTEKEYRSLELNSYSSLKVYIESPLKFYKKFVLKEKQKDEQNSDMIMGTLVDTLYTSPEELNSKFEISTVSEIDKDANHMNFFAWTLWEKTLLYTDENGVLTKDFSYLCSEAYNDSKYNRNGEVVRFKIKDLEKVIAEFEGSNLELWYKQKRSSFGKIMVNLADIENAEKVVNELRSNSNTSSIINQETDERYTVYYQKIILFQYNGMNIKIMIDKLIVDNVERKIYIYDLKCTWEVLSFSRNYLKNYYYLQGAVYYNGVKQWASENGFGGYEIVPIKFIVAHSANFLQPLIYPTNLVDLEAAINGFSYFGKKYMGMKEAIDSVSWSLETGIWSISLENYLAGGIKPLNLQYDKL